MAGKLKVDLSGVKSFFIDKGEKIALAACVLAAVLLVALGVLDAASVRTAPGSTQSYDVALRKAAEEIKRKVDTAPPNKEEIDKPENTFQHVRWEWLPANLAFQFSEFFGMPDVGTSKRINPRVLPIVAGDANFAMWYMPGTIFSLDINAAQAKQTINVFEPQNQNEAAMPAVGKNKQALNAQPVIITKPIRMVVVNCVFPMQEQLKVFQEAFRMQSQAELFASKDLPRPLGLNIWKTEVIAGKQGEWKPLIVAKSDANGETTLIIDPALRRIYREAILDEETNAQYRRLLLQGLVMPLPRLAILPAGRYPALKLNALEFDDDDTPPAGEGRGFGGRGEGRGMGGMGGAMPGMNFNPFPGPGGAGGAGGAQMGAAGNAMVRIDVPWKAVSKDLQDQLHDRTNILDPKLINFDPEEDPKDAAQPALPGHVPVLESVFQGNSPFAAKLYWEHYPKPAAPGVPGVVAPRRGEAGPAQTGKPYDALVRFIDPTVQPGKTYQYMVEVRMANPNFGKKDAVAILAHAEVKELKTSTKVETPTITIPDEYYLYAVDQKPAFKVKGGSDWDTPKETVKQEHIAVQIHRWIDEAKQSEGGNPAIGDWCIAERLYLRRGDPVGKPINVEVPTWNPETKRFELGRGAGAAAGPKQGQPVPPFRKGFGAPPAAAAGAGIEVNFQVTTPPPVLVDFDGGKRFAGAKLLDDSSSNLLILRADGSLIVRNTRVDSEDASPLGKERVQRFDTWKAKTAPLRDAGNPLRPPMPGGIFGNKGS